MWAELQDVLYWVAGGLPSRSTWPSMALPNVLLVQLLQVRLRLPGNAFPSMSEPVMMSCMLGVSPRILTGSPFSLSAVVRPILLLALCRSATLVAITAPLAFCHGPLPMRSRALTGPPCAPWLVLRYARQVLPPAPAACASCWQCASAPARPPRSAPLPDPTLVMKKVMLFCACPLPDSDRAISAAEASTPKRIAFFMGILHSRLARSSQCAVPSWCDMVATNASREFASVSHERLAATVAAAS